MSFWKSLFGGGASSSDPAAAKVVKQIDYKGFTIAARPYAEGGQYQVSGAITKEIDGALKSHKFVRADRFTTVDDAADSMITKAQQLIDQQGDRIFN